jgi:hypothetical protein
MTKVSVQESINYEETQTHTQTFYSPLNMKGESTAVMHGQTSYLKQKQTACINKSANHNTMRGSMSQSQYSYANMKPPPPPPNFMYFTHEFILKFAIARLRL